jgi:hypothetical protein
MATKKVKCQECRGTGFRIRIVFSDAAEVGVRKCFCEDGNDWTTTDIYGLIKELLWQEKDEKPSP